MSYSHPCQCGTSIPVELYICPTCLRSGEDWCGEAYPSLRHEPEDWRVRFKRWEELPALEKALVHVVANCELTIFHQFSDTAVSRAEDTLEDIMHLIHLPNTRRALNRRCGEINKNHLVDQLCEDLNTAYVRGTIKCP